MQQMIEDDLEREDEFREKESERKRDKINAYWRNASARFHVSLQLSKYQQVK